jgi:hypothetical protein
VAASAKGEKEGEGVEVEVEGEGTNAVGVLGRDAGCVGVCGYNELGGFYGALRGLDGPVAVWVHGFGNGEDGGDGLEVAALGDGHLEEAHH